MYNLYKNIEILCDEKGENITQMCKIAGVPRGNLTDLKMGRQNGLSSKNLHKIAAHFGVTVEFLLTGENKKSAPIIESGLNRKTIFAEMLYRLPDRDRLVIEHNIQMLYRLAQAEGKLKHNGLCVDIDLVMMELEKGRDRLLGGRED